MNTELALTRQSPISKALTMLPDKVIVDFVNGIDVVRDHVRVQSSRHGLISRFMDGLSGGSSRRQASINASLADGVEGALMMLNEFNDSLAQSNLAVSRINERVSSLVADTARIANFAADTRDLLRALSMSLGERCTKLEQEVLRIDFVQRAQIHLEHVFSRWEAGQFASFAPAARGYIVMEELRWGDFGGFCRAAPSEGAREKLLETLANRCVARLAMDAKTASAARLNADYWLALPAGGKPLPDAREALAYLGDETSPDDHPFAYSATQCPRQFPDALPRLSSAERVGESLVSEVFGEASYV